MDPPFLPSVGGLGIMGGQRVAPLCAASILSVACKLLEGRRFLFAPEVLFYRIAPVVSFYMAGAAASSVPLQPLDCLYCLYSLAVFWQGPILLYAAWVCGLFLGKKTCTDYYPSVYSFLPIRTQIITHPYTDYYPGPIRQ